MAPSKLEIEHFEHVNHSPYALSLDQTKSTQSISEEHRQYLIARHGTADLDPLPEPDDADPYNWPQWKKLSNLILVAVHALMSTFISSAIIPSYETIAEDLGVSLQRTTYLTSLQIAILGGAPFLWRPISNRFGRRPIFLLSLLLSLVCNIGCAKSPDYASMAACRALVAFFISPAGAIGSGVVMETFFKKDRARYMGLWTLLLTLGVPLAPFIFGFVALRIGYRWTYYILAIINAVQFILYLFLGPETRYIRQHTIRAQASYFRRYFTFHRIDPAPFTVGEFFSPLQFFGSASVLIAACAYSMVFLFGSVMITVEIPQLFAQKFGFNSQQLGLQFIGVIIGAVLGEQVGGFCSDSWMKRHARNTNRPVAPEYRLWLSYIGFPIAIMGAVVFLVQTANAPNGHWNVTPIVGAAFAAAGNQIVTTIMVTYAVDSRPDDAAGVGVFITFVRQTWAFIGPFWLPDMFDSAGLKGSAGIVSALIIGASIFPTIGLQLWKASQAKARGNGGSLA